MINITELENFFNDCKGLSVGEWQSLPLMNGVTLNCGADNSDDIPNAQYLKIELEKNGKVFYSEYLFSENFFNGSFAIPYLIASKVLSLTYDCVDTNFGNIFFEKVGQQEEPDRIKILDSYGKYIDYFAFDYKGAEAVLKEFKREVALLRTTNDFVTWIGYDGVKMSLDINDIAKEIYFDDRQITEAEFQANEQTNKIGKWYLYIPEK